MVVYYPFDGNTNVESGNGNNLTNNNSTPVHDRFGNPNNAFQFLNSYMEKTSANNLPMGNSSKSIFCWVRSGYLNTQVLVEWGTHEYSKRFALMTYTDSHEFISGFANDVWGNLPASNGYWNHIVVTYENRNLKLYVNGGLDKNDTIPLLNTTINKLRLGRANNDTEALTWMLDDVRMFNRAISSYEVNLLYHEGSRG